MYQKESLKNPTTNAQTVQSANMDKLSETNSENKWNVIYDHSTNDPEQVTGHKLNAHNNSTAITY